MQIENARTDGVPMQKHTTKHMHACMHAQRLLTALATGVRPGLLGVTAVTGPAHWIPPPTPPLPGRLLPLPASQAVAKALTPAALSDTFCTTWTCSRGVDIYDEHAVWFFISQAE